MSYIKCPHCGHRYDIKSLKGEDMVVTTDGIPALVCIECNWQVPLLEFATKHDQKKLLERVKALENELPIPNLKGDR